MAVSASALTLPQYAVQSNDPLVQRITYSLLEYGNAMADIPFANKKTLQVNGVRWEGNLPSVDWVPVNTDPVVVSGTPTAYQEQAYITRGLLSGDTTLDFIPMTDAKGTPMPIGDQYAAGAEIEGVPPPNTQRLLFQAQQAVPNANEALTRASNRRRTMSGQGRRAHRDVECRV